VTVGKFRMLIDQALCPHFGFRNLALEKQRPRHAEVGGRLGREFL